MTQAPLCLAAADIHGNKGQYEKIKQLVREHGISLVCLAGDLLPKDGGSWSPENKIRTIGMQRDFITSYFLPYLQELGTLTTVCAIFGNDDFKSNYPLVADAKIANVHFLDNEAVALTLVGEAIYVAGYPYVGVTPFLQKDWEKRETEDDLADHKIHRSDGFISRDGKHHPVELNDRRAHQATLENDLRNLARMSPPDSTIYIFHEAPYNTPLDQVAKDNKYIKDGEVHVGSKSVRRFIEDSQPLITIHGHIHETLDQSGDYRWLTGRSTAFTPANDFKSETLSCVLFSPCSPRAARRITV